MLQRHRQDADATVPNLDLNQIKVIGALGRGAKGVVFLVRYDLTGEFLALKVILKELIHKNNSKVHHHQLNLATGGEYRRINFEQEVLARFHHPLLPTLRGVLSTETVIGYAIDYCSGHDLNSLRCNQTDRMFSDDAIRFYAAELVLALEYVHSLGIVYRDLKPDNIMIQGNGHIMLVDFDLSTKLPPARASPLPEPASVELSSPRKKRFSALCSLCSSPEPKQRKQSVVPESETQEKSNSFVGTEEYVAPEIILGKGHDFAVDWWSLGVVLHEMLYGTTPFRGSNRKETFYRILSKAPGLEGKTTPLRDLIGKLLEKDPKQRIHVEGIKKHGYFRGLDWDSVMDIYRPPYIPNGAVTDEDMEGIKKIDVELFVRGIFSCNKDADQKINDDDDDDDDGRVKVPRPRPRPLPCEAALVF